MEAASPLVYQKLASQLLSANGIWQEEETYQTLNFAVQIQMLAPLVPGKACIELFCSM